MARIFVTVILLFSFASAVAAADSCCFEKQEKSDCVQSHGSDHDNEDSPECLNCVRCASGLHITPLREAPAQELNAGQIFSDYRPLLAPMPDIAGLLRPPIV